jgi:hypothetical protein
MRDPSREDFKKGYDQGDDRMYRIYPAIFSFIAFILFLVSLVANATFLPATPNEIMTHCQPGSPLLKSDICWGKTASQILSGQAQMNHSGFSANQHANPHVNQPLMRTLPYPSNMNIPMRTLPYPSNSHRPYGEFQHPQGSSMYPRPMPSAGVPIHGHGGQGLGPDPFGRDSFRHPPMVYGGPPPQPQSLGYPMQRGGRGSHVPFTGMGTYGGVGVP